MHDGGPKDLAWIAPNGSEIRDEAWHDAGSHTLGMFVAGDIKTHDDQLIHDDSFLFIVHAGAEATEFTLPSQPYGSSFLCIIDTYTDTSAGGAVLASGERLTVGPYSSVLLQISN